jgi:VWFA-related protein
MRPTAHPLLTRALLAAAVGAAAFVATARPAAQQLQFRTGADVVVIDVTVVDPSGRPIGDLALADFQVVVDGKLRAIASSQFLRYDIRLPGVDPKARVAQPPLPSQVAVSPLPPPRSVLIVVDEDSMEPGEGVVARQAAERFVDRLAPVDRVGVASIPRSRASVALTTDRTDARRALAAIVTGIEVDRYEFNIGLAEAFAVERSEGDVATRVVNRECRGVEYGSADPSVPLPPLKDDNCPFRVQSQIRQMQLQAHIRGQRSIDALRQLAAALRQLQGPKTMVLVSGGMPMPDVRSTSAFDRLQAEFAEGQVALYTLYMERSSFGQAGRKLSPTPMADDLLERDGIENATSVTGGTLMNVVGSVDQSFDRITSELSGVYLLTIDVDAADRDGKPHLVQVKVSRRGVQVRARKQYVIGAARADALAAGAPDRTTPTEGGAIAADSEASLGPTVYRRMLTVASESTDAGEVKLQVKATRSTPTSKAGRGVLVEARIDPRSIDLYGLENRRVGRLAIGVFCGDAKRSPVGGQAWHEMTLALTDDTYQRFKRDGIPYATHVPATGASRYVKVVVYDLLSGRVGAMTAKVK